jgi:hypothetical protein
VSFYSRHHVASLDAANHTSIGYHPETYDELLVPNIDRYSGTYVLGVQGSGKSGLLQNNITADMHNGHAVIVIDPHGDLVKDCLSHVPTHRLGDTYLLDMEDTAFPFGCNIFSTGKLTNDILLTQAVERILHIFYVLWPEVVSQQNLPRYLHAATLTMLANPGTTLVDMHTFLQDQLFRNRLLANVTDMSVRRFWADQYDSLGPHEQYRRVQPLVGRLWVGAWYATLSGNAGIRLVSGGRSSRSRSYTLNCLLR